MFFIITAKKDSHKTCLNCCLKVYIILNIWSYILSFQIYLSFFQKIRFGKHNKPLLISFIYLFVFYLYLLRFFFSEYDSWNINTFALVLKCPEIYLPIYISLRGEKKNKKTRCTSPVQLTQVRPDTAEMLFFVGSQPLSYLSDGSYFRGCALRRSWRNPGCRSYCIQEAPFWSPSPRKQGGILMPYYRGNHAPVCSSSEVLECWAYAVV